MNADVRPGGAEFPCQWLGEALPHLRRPPTPAAVRFKIQNAVEEAGQVAAYIDARLVFDRLDAVCGARWWAAFEPLPKELRSRPADRDGQPEVPPLDVRCRLTAFGVTRQDVGAGETPKAAVSDAVKRAAVQFGIGRALYALRLPWLAEGAEDGELRRNRRGRLVLDARTEAWCREQYERWLERKGRRMFGEPLDHGDDLGAPGYESDAEVQAGGDEPPADIDQGLAAAAEHQLTEPGEERPGRGAEDGFAPFGSSEAERPQTVRGRLQAVSDGTPGEPPATAIDRQLIARWRQAGAYEEETVAALAGLACGERVVERLDREQVRRVAWLLELAVAGRVSQISLANAVTRAARRYEFAKRAEELEAWLRQQADDAGPRPAQAA
jgi:Rad52/22 family double-strand break repair protein